MSHPLAILGAMEMHHAEQRLVAAAEARYGLLTTDDLEAAGLPPWVAENRVREGRWVRLHREVFRVVGSGPSFEQTLLAAVLAAGTPTVASHRAAARLRTWSRFDRCLPEVTRARGRSGRGPVIVHRSGHLRPDHITQLRGIPVTTVPRTLFDLAGVVHPGRVERTLDAALASRQCSLDEVRDVFCSLARRGRRGTATMRALLDERGAKFVAPASELEHRARQLLARSGLPEPEHEVTLGDDRGPIGRVDCLWRRAGLVVEWDGLRFHSSLSAARDDAQRDRRFGGIGLRVRRFTWFDVTERPEWVMAELRTELGVQRFAA